MILTELLSPRRDDQLWSLIRQAGVEHVVSLLDGGEQDARMFASVGATPPHPTPFRQDEAPWSEAKIAKLQRDLASGGFEVIGLEDTPPLDAVRLNRPGRDLAIEQTIIQVRAMGELGIPLLCYNWMALSSWARTEVARPSRGGALVTAYRDADAHTLPPIPGADRITSNDLWDGLTYFLACVLPEAERAGVRLAMHPDDPPNAIVRGMPRIMDSSDAFRRLLALDASPANAITLCQGNFALMGDDLPNIITEFAHSGAIAFVHFRDVRGTSHDFVETFHDDGQTDMAACLRAYARAGFEGPIRPDHVPTMSGESNESPGYGRLGRLYALGYIRGLMHASRGR